MGKKLVDINAIKKIINKGMLKEGEYVLTDHYLALPRSRAKVLKYLEDKNYSTKGGECACYSGKEELLTIYINR